MVESSRAIFLSYASQDAEAAKHICESLRAIGIEVWFDQSELRGGDAWDRRISSEIRQCALFIAVISRHTDARAEGYFRREWRVAVDRTRDMADDAPFLLPIVIDETPDATARVPDKFREVQWTRLTAGHTPPQFVQRVAELLRAGEHAWPGRADTPVRVQTALAEPRATMSNASTEANSAPVARRRLLALSVLGAALLAAVAFIAMPRLTQKHEPDLAQSSSAAVQPGPPKASAAVDKSIAVLPFVDMSEKKDQEYFSDGLAEELIDQLTQNPALKVIARTSSFQFKGKNEDMRSIADKLGVTSLLEGSVRKTGRELRITVQLIRASDGVHLWSKTYDRKLDDIFKIQAEIAMTVAKAMNVALLEAARSDVAGTTSVEAYNLYLQAISLNRRANSLAEYETATSYVRDALRADPHYAAAWGLLTDVLSSEADEGFGSAAALRKEAKQAAEHALELDADVPESHLAMVSVLMDEWDFALAEHHAREALRLGPNSSLALGWASGVASIMGRLKEGEELALRGIRADPVNPFRYEDLSGTLVKEGRFPEALAAHRHYMDLKPGARGSHNFAGFLLLLGGDPAAALAEMDRETDENYRQECYCRVMVYDALGRNGEAAKLLTILEERHANDEAYGIAGVYATRSDRDRAFLWLNRAYEQHDSGMRNISTDPLFRNLEVDPRLNALIRKMRLPERHP